MADIMGMILQAIGGQKLKQVATVFAEGSNITRQAGGGIGLNSIINQIPQLQNIMSSNGLSGVFTNVMSGNISSMTSTINNAVSTISSMTTMVSSVNRFGASSNSSSSTQTATPTYPNFSKALTQAISTLATYQRMTDLLSGVAVPDYTTTEYGLVEILGVSSSGTAQLSDLSAPLSLNSVMQTAIGTLQVLLATAESNGVSDSSAVTQLNSIMSPILSAMAQSQAAYNTASSDSSSQTLVSQVCEYLDGTNTPEASFVSNLMNANIVSQIVAANQAIAAENNANRASANKQALEKAAVHREIMKIIKERS